MIQTGYVYNHQEDVVVVERRQDVEPIIERNKWLQKEGPNKRAFFRQFASVPNIVIEQWFKMGVNALNPNDFPKVKKLLNSPEYKYLKTVSGKV